MSLGDGMLITSMWGIWVMLVYWIFLSIGAVRYHFLARAELVQLSRWQGPYPFVSILVPAHNEAVVIERTARALCQQRYPDNCFEVIVINDGSQDGTGAIVRELTRDYRWVRAAKENRGRST